MRSCLALLLLLLTRGAAAGPRVDEALAGATNLEPSPVPRAPPSGGSPSGLPPTEHANLVKAMKDWQETAVDLTEEMFRHKYGNRLAVDPSVLFNKLDVDGDGKINAAEITQGGVNLEQALKRAEGSPDAGTAKASPGGDGMDFSLFSKMLAMDPHKPRDPGHLFTQMDKDEDGLISQSEFASYKHLLSEEL